MSVRSIYASCAWYVHIQTLSMVLHVTDLRYPYCRLGRAKNYLLMACSWSFCGMSLSQGSRLHATGTLMCNTSAFLSVTFGLHMAAPRSCACAASAALLTIKVSPGNVSRALPRFTYPCILRIYCQYGTPLLWPRSSKLAYSDNMLASAAPSAVQTLKIDSRRSACGIPSG